MRKTLVRLLVIFGLLFGLTKILAGTSSFLSARAETEPTPGPNRKTSIQVDATEYYWWLVYWSDNSVVCTLTIDHDGKPTSNDVLNDCGSTIFDKWQNTPACLGNESGAALQACKGMYLHNTGQKAVTKDMEVDLAPAVIWVEISGCVYDPDTGVCSGSPALLFKGEESLPNETITKLHIKVNSQEYTCDSSECTVALPATSEKGVPFSFWGDSSYGDSTILYEGLVRAVPVKGAIVENIPSAYYIDILSPQWKTGPAASCDEAWQVFPEIGKPPAWLDTPKEVSGLQTSIPYYYLAAMLIRNNIVDASSCPNGGLESNLAANQCGLETAQPEVTAWQNQFDEQINQTSVDTGIPSQLLKNMFAQESQLWPGVYGNVRETGFGHLTENGADAALLWNRSFYDQFCPLVLSTSTCTKGFAMLTNEQQALLRGALVQSVNAACKDCPSGIDLTQARFSIPVFAQTLIGNCSQVNRLLYNVTHQQTDVVARYSDLWRFTLINYTAGPGCLFEAVSRTYKANDDLTWINVAANLAEACRPAVDYVVKISQGDTEGNIVFSTPLPTPTKTPIKPTATVTKTRTATSTRTATITQTTTLTITPSITPSPSPTETATLTQTPTLTQTTTSTVEP